MNTTTIIRADKAAFFKFIASEPEGRFEYVRGRIMQQQGGTLRHARIAQRFASVIERQLDPTIWFVSANSHGIETPQTVRYPDAIVEPVDQPPDTLATSCPAIVVEVLSPDSDDRDLDVKPGEYLALASLQAYVVAGQDEAVCYVWVRDSQGAFPHEPVTVIGYEKIIEVPALSVSIPLAEIYRDIVPDKRS